MSGLAELKKVAHTLGSPQKAVKSLRFFKTGPGQYGAGDKFLGLTVPESRGVVKRFWEEITLTETETLLHSKWHEERLIALLILIKKFRCGDEVAQAKIYRVYLKNTTYINNWDLVDCSAEYIVGAWLEHRERAVLDKLVCSKSLWERRIAIIATFAFIKQGEVTDTFRMAEKLLSDTHDLIHKAVGWMLREVGKRASRAEEEKFLRRYAARMPRTMLRYAIEHFGATDRARYLGMKANAN